MSKWISVEDRLPDHSGWYIVTGTYIDYELAYFNPQFGWDDIYNYSEIGEHVNYEITHWIPLPELPNSK